MLLSSELDGGVETVGRAMRWAFLNTEREFFLGIDPHITRKITLQIEIQVRHMNSDTNKYPPLSLHLSKTMCSVCRSLQPQAHIMQAFGVCVCVCVCARACAFACACVCVCVHECVHVL